jgi:hypothetical protein
MSELVDNLEPMDACQQYDFLSAKSSNFILLHLYITGKPNKELYVRKDKIAAILGGGEGSRVHILGDEGPLVVTETPEQIFELMHEEPVTK